MLAVKYFYDNLLRKNISNVTYCLHECLFTLFRRLYNVTKPTLNLSTDIDRLSLSVIRNT